MLTTNKEFYKTREWEDWLWIWEQNMEGKFSRDGKRINVHIAKELLHIGPEMFSLDAYEMKNYKAVKFYLDVAWWWSSRNKIEQIEIARKAYEVLVTKLIPSLRESWWTTGWYIETEKEISLVKQIIEFFSSDRIYFPRSDAPRYIRASQIIVRGLYQAITGKYSIGTSISHDAAKILSKEKENLIKALLNVDELDFIVDEKIFEAIPILEKKITDYIWKAEYKKDDRDKFFPGGKEEFIRVLDRIDPKALNLIFNPPQPYCPSEEPQALIALLAKRPNN